MASEEILDIIKHEIHKLETRKRKEVNNWKKAQILLYAEGYSLDEIKGMKHKYINEKVNKDLKNLRSRIRYYERGGKESRHKKYEETKKRKEKS